ncbi:hypothetical protein BQ8482_570006 [Mesorhizobium delmotii]|uniref:Uncharacterized protein n=1 Tax=Mesorhizobium delmotii TaxID=1631247 RepID=A0A2P9AUV7_9HYPH|nr:hypothetical protein BQ8482_570006 [Mesorhizobium delmotii]
MLRHVGKRALLKFDRSASVSEPGILCLPQSIGGFIPSEPKGHQRPAEVITLGLISNTISLGFTWIDFDGIGDVVLA